MFPELSSLLAAICTAPTKAALAGCIADRLAESRSTVLARVWYLDPAGGLTLAGSAGTPSGGGSYHRLDGAFASIPAHAGKIGSIAAMGLPTIVRGVRGDEDWLVNKSWAARQGVRAFVGLPMLASQQVIGVAAIFDRELPDDDAIERVQIALNVAAYRVHDLAEQERLTTRLEELTSRAAPSRGPEEDEGHEEHRRAGAILTRAEMRRLERANIVAALARSHGKVFGADGAAALLGMKPTTLASKMTVLGLRRPRNVTMW
jgi:GAF domain-containing protein